MKNMARTVKIWVFALAVMAASIYGVSSNSSTTVDKGHIYRVEFAQDQVVCYAYANWSDDAVALQCIDKLSKRVANEQGAVNAK